MEYWAQFGLRQMPSWSARRPSDFAPQMRARIEDRTMSLGEPFRGLTTDGLTRPGLFPLRVTGVSTAPVTEAAVAFVDALDAEQRQRAVFPLDADERRKWMNAHFFVFRHGVMLEDLSPATRRLGLGLVQASLSARGFAQARDIMRLNRLLGELTGQDDEYGEWLYFLSFFGEPGEREPWAWQIDGHHLCINCTIIGDQVVLTPAFMGSEPCQVFSGPLAGTMVFTAEERAGVGLIRSLGDGRPSRRSCCRLCIPTIFRPACRTLWTGEWWPAPSVTTQWCRTPVSARPTSPRASGIGCGHWWLPMRAGSAKGTPG
jgi:hypothetical protein